MKVFKETYGCHPVIVVELESGATIKSPVGITVNSRDPIRRTAYINLEDFKPIEEIHGEDVVKELRSKGMEGNLATHRALMAQPLVRQKIRYIKDVVDSWYKIKARAEKSGLKVILPTYNGPDKKQLLSGITADDEFKILMIEVRIMKGDKIVRHGLQNLYGFEVLDKSAIKVVTHG